MYQKAKEKMKYFDFYGYQAKALTFENDMRDDKKYRDPKYNVFYKLPKNSDKKILTY